MSAPAAGCDLDASDFVSLQRPARGRASRIVVCGPGAGAAGLAVAQRLGQAGRTLLLDAVSAEADEGPGLSGVMAGRCPLAHAIAAAGGGIHRLGRGPGHPDRLIEDPHGLAVVIDALAFSYEVLVMAAPDARTSVLGEVLAAIADACLYAPAAEGVLPCSDDMGRYRRRGTARMGWVGGDGRPHWLPADAHPLQ